MANSDVSCLIVAGEKSGEEHALTFLPQLKSFYPQVRFFGVGGEALQEQGVELLYHLKDFSSMGFSEVIGKIPFYFKALDHLEQECIKRRTKYAILVDFQGFNMRLAARLKKHGVKVLYYVAPQAWAWKAHRTKALKRDVFELFTILPFEKAWFHQRGVEQITGVPHPLVHRFAKEIEQLSPKKWEPRFKISPRLLLLPGSRFAEVSSLMPHLVETVKLMRQNFPELEVGIVKVPHLPAKLYDYYLERDWQIWQDEQLAQALNWADVAVAASGTVTLATGLFGVPTVVTYRSSLLNEFMYYNFVKYRGDVSLTNVILGHRLFPELIQGQAIASLIRLPLSHWLTERSAYDKATNELARIPELLYGEVADVGSHMAKLIKQSETQV